MLIKISILFGLVLAAQVFAKPDLGIRSQITGSSNGNIYGTGNIVSNARSLVSLLANGKYSFNGRWSSLNSSYYLTAMSLKDYYNNMTIPITNTMNAIINVAVNRNQTQNLTNMYQPIMDNYNEIWTFITSIGSDSLVAVYGSGMQGIYDNGIIGIVNELANMNGDYLNISSQIEIIRSLGSSSASLIAPYLPYNNIANVNNGLKRINAITKIMISNFTDIVAGLRLADNFVNTFNASLFKAQSSANQSMARFNNTVYSAVGQYNTSFLSSYKQIITAFNSTLEKLTNLTVDPIIGSAATATIENITNLLIGLQGGVPAIQDGLTFALNNVEVSQMNILYNSTQPMFDILMETSRNISWNLTERIPYTDICYNRFIRNNYTSLINMILKAIDSCIKGENGLITRTVLAPLPLIGALNYDAQAIAAGIQYCLQLGGLNSPNVIKVQIANCLINYLEPTYNVFPNIIKQKDVIMNSLNFDLASGLSFYRLEVCIRERINEILILWSYHYASLQYCIFNYAA